MPPFVVAVDLGGTQIRAALCGTDGQIFRRVARLTEAREGPDAVIARIFEAITEAIGDAPAADVAGIGIGVPGPLNPTPASCGKRLTCPVGRMSRSAR